MDFRDFFLKQKEVARKRTRTILPKIPRENPAWTPAPGALSLGLLLKHIGHSEAGVREVPLYNRWSYYERRIPEGLLPILGEPGSIEQEIERMEKIHQETMDLVAGAPAEIFDQEFRNEALHFRRKGYAILFGIIEHEVHHRAQLLTYMRLMGHPNDH